MALQSLTVLTDQQLLVVLLLYYEEIPPYHLIIPSRFDSNEKHFSTGEQTDDTVDPWSSSKKEPVLETIDTTPQIYLPIYYKEQLRDPRISKRKHHLRIVSDFAGIMIPRKYISQEFISSRDQKMLPQRFT
uniref:Uncharacterized protein n=1 Tax=Vespula pensylvanica TaxID=30213 RepID=A0A834KVT8_VESPE|nr:hypothetical protein H0235_012961 [Vespula pensylvanica]